MNISHAAGRRPLQFALCQNLADTSTLASSESYNDRLTGNKLAVTDSEIALNGIRKAVRQRERAKESEREKESAEKDKDGRGGINLRAGAPERLAVTLNLSHKGVDGRSERKYIWLSWKCAHLRTYFHFGWCEAE